MGLPIVATLGTVQFHGWIGRLASVQNLVDVFSRLGQAGSGAQITATRSAQKECNAWIACYTKSDALQRCIDVEALQGTVVRLTDPWARNLSRVRVQSASAEMRAGKGTAISGTAGMTHLVMCSMTLEFLP